MKFTKTMIVAGMILGAGQVFAANAPGDREKDINLSAEVSQYLELIGTSVDGVTKDITAENNVAGNGTSTLAKTIGTLGLTSNIPGTCTISFSSSNGFKLVKGGGGLGGDKTLTTYKLTYLSQAIIQNGDNKSGLTCNTTAPSNLDYAPIAATAGIAEAGVYTDTVTVIVTNQ